MLFFFHDTAPTEIYTLSLHDALPILMTPVPRLTPVGVAALPARRASVLVEPSLGEARRFMPTSKFCASMRSEEHTSELQSRLHLVCRLLLEKKKRHSPSTPHACERPP